MRRDQPFGEEKSGGELEVVAGCPHRHGDADCLLARSPARISSGSSEATRSRRWRDSFPSKRVTYTCATGPRGVWRSVAAIVLLGRDVSGLHVLEAEAALDAEVALCDRVIDRARHFDDRVVLHVQHRGCSRRRSTGRSCRSRPGRPRRQSPASRISYSEREHQRAGRTDGDAVAAVHARRLGQRRRRTRSRCARRNRGRRRAIANVF